MTYFGFLLRFLLIPIVLLGLVFLLDKRRSSSQPAYLWDWRGWGAVGAHIVVAVLYTTGWDNYLVATGVWWYDPALVTGITLGWVPLEEYTFFVLQTLLAGMWVLFLSRRLIATGSAPESSRPGLRWACTLTAASLWVGAVTIWLVGWQPGTYLALELAWALPPIGLQLAFGADILWAHRRLLALAILPLTLYLSLADALAIGYGTWTINPRQSLGLLLGGILPVEELVFFLLTNTLVSFGVLLLLAPESQARLHRTWKHWSVRLSFLSKAGAQG